MNLCSRPIAIMAAMPDELQAVLDAMTGAVSTQVISLREFHLGQFAGRPCVLALSRIGKVAAAATAVTLIQRFDPVAVIVTGLAGGIRPGVQVGDVVIGSELIQYDLDARPLFPRFEAPLLGIARFPADPTLSAALQASAERFLVDQAAVEVARRSGGRLRLHQPQVHVGMIGTGDRFVHGAQAADDLHTLLPDVMCCEMEGAAVAQVCHEHGVPFAVARTISDRADQTASIDFTDFLHSAAGLYARQILMGCLQRWPG